MKSMSLNRPFTVVYLSLSILMLTSCAFDKLEARLQADPQCKGVINPKTGALMPCPGSDKEFYKSIPSLHVKTPAPNQESTSQGSFSAQSSPSKPTPAPVECKPALHQKSGALMPCPAL